MLIIFYSINYFCGVAIFFLLLEHSQRNAERSTEGWKKEIGTPRVKGTGIIKAQKDMEKEKTTARTRKVVKQTTTKATAVKEERKEEKYWECCLGGLFARILKNNNLNYKYLFI